MDAPQLTYFCELDTPALETLFARPDVMDFLVTTRAGLSLGITDLSEGRARVVRQLNAAGVPVTAWLLLPREQGYWFNLDNAAESAARYEEFRDWTARSGLLWERVGIDIEPDIRAVQSFGSSSALGRWNGLRRLLRHTFNTSRLIRGQRMYRDLIERIRADGYPVETYQYPMIADERAAHSTILQRLTGMVDLPQVQREVFMLYSSFMRPWGPGILWSYSAQADAVAVGSTGGGVELEGALNVQPLNWAELQADLLLARQHTPFIYVFSLEGCVEQDFLPRLASLDWRQPDQVPYSTAIQVENIRKPLRRGLWLLSRPAWLLYLLALLTSAAALIGRRRR